MTPFIAPSILAADFANLQRDIEMINRSEADYLHIDIMDGVFVPNISFGFPVTQAIAKHSKKPLDFHLMISKPDQYLQQCRDSGAEIISVHHEVCTHLHRTLSAIKELGAKAGVVLNPHTPIEVLKDIVGLTDLVLIMSVNPGFGGQKFIESTYTKLIELKKLADGRNPKLLIEVDGGVDLTNAKKLVQAGANMLVAGSAVFQSADPVHTIHTLRNV